MNARVRKLEVGEAVSEERLAMIEERLNTIEKRIGPPPPRA
jgi:hypothetical protein